MFVLQCLHHAVLLQLELYIPEEGGGGGHRGVDYDTERGREGGRREGGREGGRERERERES